MGLEKIALLRKALNMSVEELSEKSGVPLGTLSKISAGITKDPKLETVKAIARALNCSLNEFDSIDLQSDLEGQAELSKDESELVNDYRELNKQGKEFIRQSMQMVKMSYKKTSTVSDVEAV